MTTGALIFAQNNGSVDYVKLAVFAAKQVKKHLGIPVALATDSEGWLQSQYPNHVFDKIIPITSRGTNRRALSDGSLSSKVVEWKNLSRAQIYNITPFQRTLVLDSDYIINSRVLAPALKSKSPFQIYKNSIDLSDWRTGQEFKRINDYSIPFYWATTFIFDKGEENEAFFDIVSYVQENWLYFRTLYNIDTVAYRNDYAFSIAIHMMNGKTRGTFATELPGTMTYCSDKDILIDIDNTKLKFLIEKKDHLGEYIAAKTEGLDVHVMNKLSLARCIDEVVK